MHFHISFMEPRNGGPYWRMIADLNPSIAVEADTSTFEESLQQVVPADLYADSKVFGDR